MSIATFDDVSARFHLPIEDDHRDLVEARLEDAEHKIRARIADLDDQIESGQISEQVVKRICADAVIRLLKNPDGYTSETDGNYTYMLAQDVANGRLMILPDEWLDLGVRKRAYVVHTLPKLPWEYE